MQAAYTLGDLAEMTGDYGAAEHMRQEGHRLAHDFELWNDASKMLARLGRSALLTGDLDRAEDLHERARRLAAAHAYQRGEEFAEVGLGLVARRQGRLDDAENHLRAWLDWCRRGEGDHGVAFILAELGFIAEQRGDADTAWKLHREGLAYARRTGDPRALALACEGLAGAKALAGAHAQAARMLGVAAAARDTVRTPLPAAERGDVDRITAIVRFPKPISTTPVTRSSRRRTPASGTINRSRPMQSRSHRVNRMSTASPATVIDPISRSPSSQPDPLRPPGPPVWC
ncbi:tetratricopeptide repeat protein [Micromonospora sp. KC606]|uniref:tetratricopeptide repeat protein n=1 Tax=Micromonospora sp. KC606 TaxID=2530379 RepID=UPI001FB67193|nr:tetratricopeptide repeat protein [Micromonospora sp. KC606]